MLKYSNLRLNSYKFSNSRQWFYRVYCSYIGEYQLKDQLALSGIETSTRGWIDKDELNRFFEKIDRFTNQVWDSKTIQDYRDCFGVSYEVLEGAEPKCPVFKFARYKTSYEPRKEDVFKGIVLVILAEGIVLVILAVSVYYILSTYILPYLPQSAFESDD